MSEEPRKATVATRARRKRQKARQIARISELESAYNESRARHAKVESRFLRTLAVAAAALERCEVATDPSGAADEAASLLSQVVRLDGSYVTSPDEPMFDPPQFDPAMREGKPGASS